MGNLVGLCAQPHAGATCADLSLLKPCCPHGPPGNLRLQIAGRARLGHWEAMKAGPFCACCHTAALIPGHPCISSTSCNNVANPLPAWWPHCCMTPPMSIPHELLTPAVACAQGVPEPGRGQAADGHRVVALGGAGGAGLPGQPRGALHRPGHHPHLGRQLDGVRTRGPSIGAFFRHLPTSMFSSVQSATC